MKYDQAQALIQEFEIAHEAYSLAHGGHWKQNWKTELPHADLKNGYWWWKGHRIADLAKITKEA